MTQTDQLEDLFKEWENTIKEYKGLFVKDGIINEDEWRLTSPKILFITKEANQYGTLKSGDFRDEWRKKGPKYPFADRMTEWAYGIINNFPVFDEIFDDHPQYNDYRQKIAFLNIKKIGGIGNCNSIELGKHFQHNLEFLNKQIEIINPEIVVLCLSFQDHLRNQLFNDTTWLKSGYDINVAKWKNARLIDFYHPSARNGPATSYSLLQNVMRSNVFKTL